MARTNCDPRIEFYIDQILGEKVKSCKEQKMLCRYVTSCFDTEDIYTDSALLDKYLSLSKYFPWDTLFPWEVFFVALHLCTFKKENGMPRFPDGFALIGRGAGKDGLIAFESFCLVSPYSGLQKYDVDICANLEEQAMRPADDIREMLESTKNRAKMAKHFYWTKETIVGRKNGGAIKGRTNNPRSRDGMRSGMVAFNEVHQYENYGNIKVFVTGLGKKKHPRRLYITTDGDVRDGVLDDLKARSLRILNGEESDNGFLPFICRLDSKDEVHEEENWVKANPSLPFLPDLHEEIEKEYIEWKSAPSTNADFMTKRMNLPQSDMDVAVTDWENIAATNIPLPDLTGRSCTIGIDYASINDFAAVNIHFRDGDYRYDINHAWLCLKSADLERIRAPWREWADAGLLTTVDDVEINPDLIAEYILTAAERYNIKAVCMDNFRFALLARALEKIGYDPKERKNIKLARPSDIMRTVPIITSAFARKQFAWGDNPVLRWAANNTKLVHANRQYGHDTGNMYYAKISPKDRKTDPFMALVASMVIEDMLPERENTSAEYLPIITF